MFPKFFLIVFYALVPAIAVGPKAYLPTPSATWADEPAKPLHPKPKPPDPKPAPKPKPDDGPPKPKPPVDHPQPHPGPPPHYPPHNPQPHPEPPRHPHPYPYPILIPVPYPINPEPWQVEVSRALTRNVMVCQDMIAAAQAAGQRSVGVAIPLMSTADRQAAEMTLVHLRAAGYLVTATPLLGPPNGGIRLQISW